ncbi:hypothetical protein FRC07_015030, partial [Ceratobasidium sp. 392]
MSTKAKMGMEPGHGKRLLSASCSIPELFRGLVLCVLNHRRIQTWAQIVLGKHCSRGRNCAARFARPIIIDYDKGRLWSNKTTMLYSTPAAIFAAGNHFDLVMRLTAGIVLPPLQAKYYIEAALRLSKVEYLLALRIFAPDHNVHKLDSELTAMCSTYNKLQRRNLNPVSVRLLDQTSTFRCVVRSYDHDFPNGQVNPNGSCLPEPETVSISRIGLRFCEVLLSYTANLILGPRDPRRMKLNFLIMYTLRETGTVDGFELVGHEQPTAFEMLCDSLARLDVMSDPSTHHASVSNSPDFTSDNNNPADADMHSSDDD